mmetsp:Transcript_14642/g.59600  ORF Transcript_14642/g.59600 Transcript_14642/m.59600 type:complete len:115 (-) Transcript_14642:1665-2009(-)
MRILRRRKIETNYRHLSKLIRDIKRLLPSERDDKLVCCERKRASWSSSSQNHAEFSTSSSDHLLTGSLVIIPRTTTWNSLLVNGLEGNLSSEQQILSYMSNTLLAVKGTFPKTM